MTHKIRRVFLVGGTHGNEHTGAALVRHWRDHPGEIEREGLEVRPVLANPRAYEAVTRYIDEDLNRCFPLHEAEDPISDDAEPTWERRRARELRREFLGELGPEQVAIFDLHTTTANMGKSVVFGRLTPFSAELGAYLCQQDPEVRMYRWKEEGTEPTFLSGITPNGFNIEVGPVPWGVLDAQVIAQTRGMVAQSLDFVVERNAGNLNLGQQSIDLYEHREHVDYPRDAEGRPRASVHPKLAGCDWQPLQPGDPLFAGLDGQTTPYSGPAGLIPVFINEAAYYEKGIALTLTERRTAAVRDLDFDP